MDNDYTKIFLIIEVVALIMLSIAGRIMDELWEDKDKGKVINTRWFNIIKTFKLCMQLVILSCVLLTLLS